MEKKNGDSDDESPYEVNIKDCLDELVNFTLQSHSHSPLLNHDLISSLTQVTFSLFFSLHIKQTNKPFSLYNFTFSFSDSIERVPPYPLYKCIASSLLKCIDSEAFCSTPCNLAMQKKYDEWHKLILDKGSEIVNILKSVSFEIHVQEPFFSQLKDGLKTIEGRCASGKYRRIELGNLILVNKSVVFEVQGLRKYPTFSDMLKTESLEKVLPGVESVEEGVKVYRRFYTEEKEQENGVLAIIVSKVALQPYISLANLFSGLSYEGVQGLLGLMHTSGTSPDALPPPR
ncbi:unnamed protein product [Lupinus luteus]|uniref:ASCH domain-containing protein n=1 Tax=Lupinus luteus TaxID=3873 RepID=A0AAV1XR60_LUPLU